MRSWKITTGLSDRKLHPQSVKLPCIMVFQYLGITSRKGGSLVFTTTISLTPEMHRQLKHCAVDEGVTMRDIIRKVLEEYLARYEEKKGGTHAKT